MKETKEMKAPVAENNECFLPKNLLVKEALSQINSYKSRYY